MAILLSNNLTEDDEGLEPGTLWVPLGGADTPQRPNDLLVEQIEGAQWITAYNQPSDCPAYRYNDAPMIELPEAELRRRVQTGIGVPTTAGIRRVDGYGSRARHTVLKHPDFSTVPLVGEPGDGYGADDFLTDMPRD